MDTLSAQQLIIPDWPAPANISAFTTTRMGGCSEAPFDRLNMGFHVNDQPSHVEENVARIQNYLGSEVKLAWMLQVHGTDVLLAEDVNNRQSQADAMYTASPQQACAILTADCLPLLFCDKQGQEVAATHAGWKGLAAGIISQTLKQFTAAHKDIYVWLGPAIGQAAFEVGQEVRETFITNYAAFCPSALVEQAFIVNPADPKKYLADLYALARLELMANGVRHIYGGGMCTYNDPRFFSYRKASNTGRMATVIVRNT